MSDSVRPHGLQPTRPLHPWDSPGKNIGVGCHFLLQCMKVESESEVAQSCLTLSDPLDCSLPGSSIHGIFQATVLEYLPLEFAYVLLLHLFPYMCIHNFTQTTYYYYQNVFILFQLTFLTQYFVLTFYLYRSVSSVAQSCPTLCNPMDCSMPGFPVHHQLPELAQTHVI